jgi:PAS domain S-box-containing protein
MTRVSIPVSNLPQIDKGTMEVMQHGVMWVNEEGHILYVNSQLVSELGYEPNDFKTKTIFQISPYLNFIKWRETWQLLEKNHRVDLEVKQMAANGAILPVKMRGVLIDADGQKVCVGFVQNEVSVKPYIDLLQMLSEMLNAGGWQWTVVNNTYFITRQMYRLLELPDDLVVTAENIQTLLLQLLSVKDYTILKEKLQHSLETGEPFEAEVGINLPVSKTVRQFWLKAVPRYEEGASSKLYGTLQDISTLSTLTTGRTEEMYLMQYSVEHAQEIIYWVAPDGTIRYANDYFCTLLGYTHKELLQKNFADLRVGLTPELWHEHWEHLRRHKTLELEVTLRAKNGAHIPVSINVSHQVYRGVELGCVFGQDLREDKRREAQLNEAFQEIHKLKEQLEADNQVLQNDIALEYNFNNIISASPAYKKVLKQIEQVADTDATVLILGETGTGKELLARALHQLSSRANRPMVKINCGAIPESLIESELFGHEKGAFTGAYQQKKGRFEMAHKGSIFLDEIGELPLDLQTKLLRVLQEGEFERVGGTQTIRVDVRVIAATNRNLEQLVQEGGFRQDLFYRLNVFPIYNLPLRERREDIPLLIKYFAGKFSEKTTKHKSILEPSPYVLEKLMEYDFPGNVRELENMVERAVIITPPGKPLQIDTAPMQPAAAEAGSEYDKNLAFKTLEAMQRAHILEALRLTNGQVSGDHGAARLLDLNDKTLHSKMKKLRIERKDYLN